VEKRFAFINGENFKNVIALQPCFPVTRKKAFKLLGQLTFDSISNIMPCVATDVVRQ
jgi:hypothetical protein